LDNPKDFLQDQKQSEHKTISTIESKLYDDDDARADGQRELLAMHKRHLRMLDELLETVGDDPMAVKVAVNKRLIKAQQAHDNADARREDGSRTDAWWRTLQDIQYLEFLQRELHSDVDIHAEQPSMSASLADMDDTPAVP